MTIYKSYVPHDVDIINQQGKKITFPSVGCARREENFSYYYKDGFRFAIKKFGAVVGLKKPEKGVKYIVSACVLDCVKHYRDDCVSPDIGQDCLRKEEGKVLAVRGFVSGNLSEYPQEEAKKIKSFYVSEYDTSLEISVPKENFGYNYLDVFIVCGDYEAQTCFNITDNEFTTSLDLERYHIQFLEEFIGNQVRLALKNHF